MGFQRDEVRMLSKPFLSTEYLGFLIDTAILRPQTSPVRLRKFRQAVNYGFDRSKIAMYLKNNIVLPAYGGFIPAGLSAFDTADVPGYHYEPDKARQLLREAGFGPGTSVPAVTLFSADQYADVANFIASQLIEVGITVHVNIQQVGMLREMAAKSALPFFRANWMADYPDGESFLACFYSHNPAPPNYTRFSNPLFDALYERALAEPIDSVRYKLYHRMDSVILSEAPVVPIYYGESVMFIHPWVQGLVNNSMGMLELRGVHILPHQ